MTRSQGFVFSLFWFIARLILVCGGVIAIVWLLFSTRANEISTMKEGSSVFLMGRVQKTIKLRGDKKYLYSLRDPTGTIWISTPRGDPGEGHFFIVFGKVKRKENPSRPEEKFTFVEEDGRWGTF